MNNIKQLQNAVFAIYAFVDGAYRLDEGLPSHISIDEVKDSITAIGLDADELLFKTHPYRAMQAVCKAVAELDISDEELHSYAEGVQ